MKLLVVIFLEIDIDHLFTEVAAFDVSLAVGEVAVDLRLWEGS